MIELLVVVLIIGILSAVALPQYEKAVEKARLSEALQNTKILRDAIDLFLLENGGFPSSSVCMRDVMTVELQGGEWSEDSSCLYITKDFNYWAPGCGMMDLDCRIENERKDTKYTLAGIKKGDSWEMRCWTQSNPLGRSICKSIESQGYIYIQIRIYKKQKLYLPFLPVSINGKIYLMPGLGQEVPIPSLGYSAGFWYNIYIICF